MNHGFGNDQSGEWMAAGGTALNGMVYGSPSSAYAYGLPGCSLVPRMFRARFPERRIAQGINRCWSVFPGVNFPIWIAVLGSNFLGPGVPEFLLRLNPHLLVICQFLKRRS